MRCTVAANCRRELQIVASADAVQSRLWPFLKQAVWHVRKLCFFVVVHELALRAKVTHIHCLQRLQCEYQKVKRRVSEPMKHNCLQMLDVSQSVHRDQVFQDNP